MRNPSVLRITAFGVFILAGSLTFAAAPKGSPEVKSAVKEGGVPSATKEGKTKGGVEDTKGKPGGPKQAALSEFPTIDMQVPLFEPEFAGTPVAAVNGDGIMVGDLASAIATVHMGKGEQTTTAKQDFADVLNRLINVKLMEQEAKNIGLDQLPEVKTNIEQFEKGMLKELLFKKRLKGVKADEKEVEKAYREQYSQWKIAPIRFNKEEDAKKMEREIKAGGKFDVLLEKAVKAGLAQGSKEASYQQGSKLSPRVLEALSRMKVGAVSPVIPVESGFAIVKLKDVKLVDDPEAKEQVRQAVLNATKNDDLIKYRAELYKKYAKIDYKLLKRLNFEAPKPGFNAMLKDRRVIATVKGDKPVTVADLAEAVQQRFFHGVDLAIKEKKVNEVKEFLFNQILAKKVVQKEALAQGLDKSTEYRDKLKDFTDSIIFGVFVEKVIRPEIRVTEDDLKAYYNEHAKEFTYPGMLRINGLAFSAMEPAQAAVAKLSQGVDYKWLKSTAEGQVSKDAPDVLEFTGDLITMTSLPEELSKVLTGVRSRDVRLYADGKGHFYALQIQDSTPPKEMPFAEVRESILPKVYGEKVKKGVDEWTKKLRAASDIKIYANFGGK